MSVDALFHQLTAIFRSHDLVTMWRAWHHCYDFRPKGKYALEEPMPTLTSRRTDNCETENHDLDGRFVAAMSAKDIDRAMSCFIDSPDLAVVLWGKEFRGRAQVRDAISTMFAAYDEITLTIDRVREFCLGDSVFAVGQATYTLKKAGEVNRLTEAWTDVRHKVNGQWVYVMDHAEALPQPME